ncbi:MAG: glycosyltransferase [bacterium]
MGISYAITVCDEIKEFKRLITQLLDIIEKDDEIIVQQDDRLEVTQGAQDIADYIYKLLPTIDNDQFQYIKYPLNKNFADFKNNLKSHCKKDYIFFIDADEYVSNTLTQHLKTILTANPGIEMLRVPRVNTVEGLTKDHIEKWRWQVDKKGYINWPDYQDRVCQNKDFIKWQGIVHEKLVGWKAFAELPISDESFALYHPKDIKRQEKQNEFYNKL